MAKEKLIFDVPPEEKRWFEELAKHVNLTKISLMRAALDEFAEKRKLPVRPNNFSNK